MKEEYIIAVCAIEESYAMQLAVELKNCIGEQYQIHSFTSVEEILNFTKQMDISLLIISETAYQSCIEIESIQEIIILQEDGDISSEKITYIDRFQPRDQIVREVMNYMSDKMEFGNFVRQKSNWKVISFYSPIKRCLQTTFALAFGQILAQKYKVLYLNFESFSGFSGLLHQEFSTDITDFLYYYGNSVETMRRKLPTLVKSINGLDFMPPPKAYLDTCSYTGKEWIEIFQTIEASSDYDYIILDLTDSVQGILDILEYSNRIYTIVKEDQKAAAKLFQYEEWIKNHEYASIMEKTMKFKFPQFQKIPEDINLLTHGELAAYAKAIIQEDLDGI